MCSGVTFALADRAIDTQRRAERRETHLGTLHNNLSVDLRRVESPLLTSFVDALPHDYMGTIYYRISWSYR